MTDFKAESVARFERMAKLEQSYDSHALCLTFRLCGMSVWEEVSRDKAMRKDKERINALIDEIIANGESDAFMAWRRAQREA